MSLNHSDSSPSMKMIDGFDGTSSGGGTATSLLRVLAIDDDPSALRMIEKSLGQRARVLQNYGAPARGELDLDGIDLVILDYKMPGRDGLDVLSEIKGAFPKLPVIFMTGFGDGEILKRSLELGADRFVAKPVSPLLLQEIVDDLFSGRREDSGEKNNSLVKTGGREVAARSFLALDESGQEVSAFVSRFSSQSVVIEFDQSVELKPGDRLTDIFVRFGRQHVTAIEGIVSRLTALSTDLSELEITLHRAWKVVEEDTPVRESKTSASAVEEASVSEGFDGADLPGDFRLAVYDFASLLRMVHQEASAFELLVATEKDEVARFEKAADFVVSAAEKHKDAFWDVMTRFESGALELEEKGLTEKAKPFARKCLYPFMLCSPFISRVVERPIGVPGDFEMLGQILGNPLEGHSLYDRIVSSYILKSGAANAYRYRINLLLREIRRSVSDCHAAGRKAKILSMASGVAYEVQEYIQHPSDGEVDFTLVDFSDDTLEEAGRQYERLGEFPESVSLAMRQSSVIDLANQSRGLAEHSDENFTPDADYDHVYCAGLFDYLSDRLIVKVIAYLHSILRPGGTLVVSNFTDDNPIKGYMTIVMDWELIYRSADEFEELVKRAVPGATYKMELDDDGSEVYAIINS